MWLAALTPELYPDGGVRERRWGGWADATARFGPFAAHQAMMSTLLGLMHSACGITSPTISTSVTDMMSDAHAGTILSRNMGSAMLTVVLTMSKVHNSLFCLRSAYLIHLPLFFSPVPCFSYCFRSASSRL